MRKARLYWVVLVVALAASEGWPQGPSSTAAPQSPDTLLVFTNGTEVKGVFLSLSEGQYSLRLSDGREMQYAAADVAKMERIPAVTPTATPTPAARPTPPPQPCGTFLTEGQLDKALYALLSKKSEVKLSKKWYGGDDEMFRELAQELKKRGADGAFDVHTWKAPSGFSWAAPHIAGQAFTWTDAGKAALPGLKGRCF